MSDVQMAPPRVELPVWAQFVELSKLTNGTAGNTMIEQVKEQRQGILAGSHFALTGGLLDSLQEDQST